ncbi:hypothetical protein OSB04_004822 [Centaurea solstitialis]|uniref:PRA1 family protein n=1 Tax=Centaurea solstitialis TaxID=347529 RepID=A0AA38TXU9_9ASTR|nr:hypothetical protein OSB04_004822 [Centaurea solstitialis]
MASNSTTTLLTTTTTTSPPSSSATAGDLKLRLILSPSPKQWTQTAFGTKRLWKQMFNPQTFTFPRTFSDFISRIKSNFLYFRTNYILFTFIVLFLSLLWHPISLMTLTIASYYFSTFLTRDEPVRICNCFSIDNRFSFAVLSVLTLVLMVLDEAVMNLLFSVSIGAAVAVVHMAVRKAEEEVCDFDENDVVEAGRYSPPAKMP